MMEILLSKLSLSIIVLSLLSDAHASDLLGDFGRNLKSCMQKVSKISQEEYKDNDEAVGRGDCSSQIIHRQDLEYISQATIKVICRDSGEPDFSESFTWQAKVSVYRDTWSEAACTIQNLEYLGGYSD